MHLRTMFRRLRNLFAPAPPPPKRLVDLQIEIAEFGSRLDYLEHELKSLRGRVTGAERRKQEASGATNGDPDISQHHPIPARAVPSTAHLAKRFKRF